jgi:hypothetical protein
MSGWNRDRLAPPVRLRRRVREEWAAGPDLESTLLLALAAWLGIPVLRLTGLLGARYFETAWAEIEAASPRLRQRVRLPLEALAIMREPHMSRR